MENPVIILTAKNEGLEVRDRGHIYGFNVCRNGDTWTLYLPGSRDDEFNHHFSSEEAARLSPAMVKYLEDVKSFGFFGGPYKVQILGK